MKPSHHAKPKLPTATRALERHRRPTGKIAHLPIPIREQLNVLLRDGLTYREVILKLGDAGKELNLSNLKRWHAGPHQRWLEDRVWIDEMSGRVDFARNILEVSGSPKSHEASLIIAVKQMYDLLASFDPATFKERLGEEPANYSRMLNALSKLAEVGLRYDQERSESVRSVARESKKSKKSVGLTDDLLRQYETEFNLLRRPPLPATTHAPEPADAAVEGE